MVGRQIFLKFRAKHKLPTRRPKERPTHFAISTERGFVNVPIAEHPTELFIYKFRSANALTGMPSNFDTSTHHWVPIAVADAKELNAFKKNHGWDGKIAVQMRPIEYAQMLAKIGHSYAVSYLGYGTFEPFAVDLILGKTNNISYAVGGDWEIAPSVKDAGHLLTLEFLIDLPRTRFLVIVEIRLFASIGTPTYHVVVGQAQSAEHIRAMADKIGNPEAIKFSLPVGK